ncbi:putative amidohydrolase YtcJ [Kibdelosporangium banguiense]|uniref:Amidohydrolase YtcJ n=1 Tax=Kibdelosporangium banguiense TaxID=1365924 RepID=A0ABS4TXT4_9PSEU|nr:amidohydrolase [Kibdelosporangium banguiense]MBP2329217.1 putative amidohydrolase YtcJ [Kibdelosporangium banguiense]
MTGGGFAELIVLADRVHTLTDEAKPVEAIAVAGGRITATGTRADIRDWRGEGTEVIDLGSATVTPGLVDGHAHPVMGLALTRGVDLSEVTSVDGLIVTLRNAAQRLTRDEWLLGWGLNPIVFDGTPVTAEPLVRAVGPHVPVFLWSFDAHSALVSPRALEIAGVDGTRDFASSARIVCDSSGCPTGHLLEREAMTLVQDVLPSETSAERLPRLLKLLHGMAATGITAGNAMDFEGDAHDLMKAAEDSGDLPVRWRFAPFVMPGSTSADLDHVLDQQRRAGRRWRVDGAKFMIDGTIDGGTAWLAEPDSEGECTAPLWPDPAEYTAAVNFLARRGVPTVTHAIGDAGIRYVLDTLAGLPRPSRTPHRIEHLETMPAELLPRFQALDVTASMQPTHCTHYTCADQSDNWSRRLGSQRAGRAFRCRDLRTHGARLTLGSDWPIAHFDPRSIIAAAQLRRPAQHADIDPVLPDQGLTALMALEGYTTQAAAAAGLADCSGRIAPGFRADLAAFVLDPLSASPDEFAESPVELTVVDGQVVHRAEAASAALPRVAR